MPILDLGQGTGPTLAHLVKAGGTRNPIFPRNVPAAPSCRREETFFVVQFALMSALSAAAVKASIRRGLGTSFMKSLRGPDKSWTTPRCACAVDTGMRLSGFIGKPIIG